MKYLSILWIFTLLLSCIGKEGNKKDLQLTAPHQKTVAKKDSTVSAVPATTKIPKDSLNEVMQEDDILFNGKLKRFFSLNDFEKVFGKADSIKLMSEEAPCTYIFENPDGSKDMNDRYLYKNGSRFENTQNKVAVDEFRFLNGNYILYKGIKIDARTTLNDLKPIFPNAIRNIGTLDVYEEGKFQVIQLREDHEGISDGHLNLFFKNNRIFFMHWWFPC
ncbi:hypothetical protein [Chryseobacterium sp. 2987]|uniref:hypothetical protein n=1 Tax=Chryseobacterium sp. 2987 TaxID=2817767 RepID=UPI0028570DB7|nr:hypothetical protein [Chryseobacterium sp. 2987]MDR6919309.1 hypothetical protein [Chryseobacterium sp. 2987]